MGAENSLSDLKIRLGNKSIAAHQGGLFGHWPNTMGAFKSAEEKGADIVEMDLHLSKDGVVVIYHDNDLDMLTNCKGPVHEKTFEELQKCRFTFSLQARISSFEEVLQWSSGKIIVDAEFKDFESIKPAIDLIQKYNAHSWVYFQAQGNREKYLQAHAYDSNVALLYAIHSDDDLNWALAQGEALMIVEIDSGMRSAATIERIHAAGKLVTEDVWHFSKSKEIFSASCDKAFEFKIDIAVTNRPGSCVHQK
jgi:glycerophosphoryl diester phosphodiesterase